MHSNASVWNYIIFISYVFEKGFIFIENVDDPCENWGSLPYFFVIPEIKNSMTDGLKKTSLCRKWES